MALISDYEWDACTAKDLLEEALACIRAVENEVVRYMPEKTRQVRNIRQAIEFLLSNDDRLKERVIQNYQAELQQVREEITQTDWDQIGPPEPPNYFE